MAQLGIRLLGTMQITLDGKPLTGFATDKARALLAYLALESARPQRRDALATLLWPDQPDNKARQNLRQTLLYLRQALDDDDQCAVPYLLVDRETVQLNPASDYCLDVTEFQALHAACQQHPHRRKGSCLPCLRRMERMADLYRGDLLEHFYVSDSTLFEEWATLRCEWLHREAIEALFTLSDYYTRRGELACARRFAWRQVELEPWREEAHRQLMRLLALEGERSAALAQYETCRRILIQELGVEPMAETTALYERIRGETGEPEERGLPSSLPTPPTPFVGREDELAELAEMIANPASRLLTLIGPGGIGKTRLALQAAAEQVGAFTAGVYHVPLAVASSVETVTAAIADALGLRLHDHQQPRRQLLDYLREKEALLVLDNVEHILPEVDLVAEILRGAPTTTLLVTSRERLNLQEEWVYEVGGLAYPTALTEEEPGEGWDKTYSAVDLFQQRACQVNRRFELTETELPAVVRICQLVEGMPLGVELAAAWVSVHSCAEIAQAIEDNLDILTTRWHNVPERHRNIRATFEHSWHLLGEAEKDLFARLSVFQRGFHSDAAVAVAGASPSALASLLDKSLLRRASSDRYDMHELLRQYAAEKLAQDLPKYELAHTQHASYFTAFLQEQEGRLKGAAQKQALAELAPESDNVRRAWQWAVSSGDAHAVERGLESLYHFYDVRCWFQTGVELFTLAIDRWDADAGKQGLLGRLLARQGALYHHQGFYQQAVAALERSLDIFERLEVPAEQVFCLVNLANAIRHQGKNEEAQQLLRQGLTLSRQIEDRRGMAQTLYLLGLLRYWAGDLNQTEALLEESLALGRELDDQRLIMAPLNSLGDAACHRGDFAKAQRMFEECLALSRALDDQFNVAIHLNNLGTVFHHLERYPEARSFYQESLAICRQIGDQSGQAIALSNLGEIAYTMGDHQGARQFYQAGLTIGRAIQEPWTIMTCLNNLGEIACAHNKCHEAQASLTEALQIAAETRTLTMATKILINLATLYAQQGQRDRAAALLDLVRRHPASEQAVQEKAASLLRELEDVQPARISAPLADVVDGILAELVDCRE
ncbi:MAG TPA: tetratricopeptide repeat protein [Chloroflexi bacterium]|nr:tetratricopeptide repeat protein [Chloroflexota bacterium]